MSIIFFCFVLYFINKRTSITNSINRANNNDYETTKRDNFRESFDLYENNEQNDYDIIELQVEEDYQSFDNTYLEMVYKS
jgi:hypothetical protein